MEHDIKRIMDTLDGIDNRLTTLDTSVSTLKDAVHTGFSEIGESIASVLSMTTQRFDRFEDRLPHRIEKLELEVTDLRIAVQKLRAEIDA